MDMQWVRIESYPDFNLNSGIARFTYLKKYRLSILPRISSSFEGVGG